MADVPYRSNHVDNDDYLTVFAVNRSLDEELELETELRGYGELALDKHIVLTNTDVKAVNSKDNPNNVAPTEDGKTAVDQNTVRSVLAPLSWNVIRLKKVK